MSNKRYMFQLSGKAISELSYKNKFLLQTFNSIYDFEMTYIVLFYMYIASEKNRTRKNITGYFFFIFIWNITYITFILTLWNIIYSMSIFFTFHILFISTINFILLFYCINIFRWNAWIFCFFFYYKIFLNINIF